MSFDLLAEFGNPQDNRTASTNQHNPAVNDQSVLKDFSFFDNSPAPRNISHQAPVQPSNQDAIWGDFSSFASPAPSKPAIAPASSFDAWGNTHASDIPNHTVATNNKRPLNQSPHPGIARVSTLDLFSNTIADLADSAPKDGHQGFPNISRLGTSAQKSPAKRDDNVLFDADDQSEDDDFGDFETVAPTEPATVVTKVQPPVLKENYVKARPSTIGTGPVNLKAYPYPSPYPQAPKSPSFQERNPFAGIKVMTPAPAAPPRGQPELKKAASPLTAWPNFETKAPTPGPYFDSPVVKQEDEDEWGDFADLPPETPAEQPTSSIHATAKIWDAVDSQPVESSAPARVDVPPSNIPPPSILLSIFPQLFDLPQSSLFKALGSQPFALKNRILSDPATVQFLRAYILIATVAARLIAGRKQRWKRDLHLAQSMSISTAGGKGGMKLAGVDRSESMREDREASEVVRVWKDQAGRLRSAIATANSGLPEGMVHLVVPDINEVMPIRTASGAEGGISAAKACLICGLKRDERIAKVDISVEDSFGEWWTEHWGHRACKNFWLEHEAKLKSR